MDYPTRLSLKGATPFFLASAASDSQAMVIFLEHGANPFMSTDIDHEILAEQSKIHMDFNMIMANATPLLVALGMGRDNMTPDDEINALNAGKILVSLCNIEKKWPV